VKTWRIGAWFGIVVVAILCAGGLPPPAQAGAALQQVSSAPDGSWVTLMTEGFEGSWPSGLWTAYDFNGPTGGQVYWDEDDYFPRTGTKSAWCANGGADGLDPLYYNYPNYMDSWATYGPFSLADATEAELQFWVWNASEPGYDYFKWLASADCVNYYGYVMSIPTDGWDMWTFDLTNVPTLGDLTGDAYVCVAFNFTSDLGITNVGAFVDDVLLRKYVPSTCYSLTKSVSPAGTGTVTANPAPNCPDDPAKYLAGTAVTLTAAANGGYTFDHWSGDASGSGNPTTITMNANKSVTAHFVASAPCYALALESEGGGGPPTADPPNSTGCSAGEYIAGEEITLTPDPDPGYVFWHYVMQDDTYFSYPVFLMPAADTGIAATYHLTLEDTGVIAGEVDVAAGGTGVIPLNLWNFTDVLVGAITVDVHHDPSIAQAIACDPDPAGALDFALCNTEYSTGTVRFTGTSVAGADGDALLANITYLGAGAPGDQTNLEVVIETLTDPAGAAFSAYEEADGEVWIWLGVSGDVDCSGTTDGTDALFVLQREVGLRPNDSFTCPPPEDGLFLPACDVSGDGACSVTDALFILQCEAGIPNLLCPAEGAHGGDRWPAREEPTPTGSVGLNLGAEGHVTDGRAAVPIWLALGEQMMGAATVELALDPAAYAIEGCAADPAGAMDVAMCQVDAARGRVTFAGLAVSGRSGDLTLATVTYRILNGSITDTEPLLTAPVLVDPAGRPIEARVRYGVVD